MSNKKEKYRKKENPYQTSKEGGKKDPIKRKTIHKYKSFNLI